MAQANRLPTTFDRIGLKYAFRALGGIIFARVLELPFETIDIRRIDRTMVKHNICSQGECALYFFDHARDDVQENLPVSRR